MPKKANTSNEIFEALARPFPDDAHEWLIQKKRSPSKLVVPYIRKPDIIDRLIEVIGFGKFRIESAITEVTNTGEHWLVGASATLVMELPDADPMKLTDVGAAESQMFATAMKGAATDAVKRVAKLAGIGLYLDRGDLFIWIREDDQDPLIRFYKEKPVAIHPSLRHRGQRLDELSEEQLKKAVEWLSENDRYMQKVEWFRMYMSIVEFGLLGGKNAN